jgi:hypothetical protein
VLIFCYYNAVTMLWSNLLIKMMFEHEVYRKICVDITIVISIVSGGRTYVILYSITSNVMLFAIDNSKTYIV